MPPVVEASSCRVLFGRETRIPQRRRLDDAGDAVREALDRLDEAFLFERSIDIETYDRHAEKLREERFRQELKLAREIQQGFLPTNFASLGGDRYVRQRPAPRFQGRAPTGV